jgi:5'-nucleotidase
MTSTPGVLLVDCDGILADLAGIWYARHNRTCTVCTEPLTTEKVLTWNVHKFTACGKAIYSYLDDPSIWRDVRPIKGARSAMRRLARFVQPVVVTTVTAGKACRAERIKWIRRYFPSIKDYNIVITANKASVKGDLLFDDAPHNLSVFPGSKLVLDYPYNQSFQDAIRVRDWVEAEARIREYFLS